MIDICTWRARIGLYRAVRVGSSGRTRAKVLLASSADGVEDWSLLLALSTIMMELVVTVLIIIPLLVLLVDTTTRYYCLQKISDAATILVNPRVNPADLLHSESGHGKLIPCMIFGSQAGVARRTHRVYGWVRRH